MRLEISTIENLPENFVEVDVQHVPARAPEWLKEGRALLLRGKWAGMCRLQAEIRRGIVDMLQPKSFLQQRDADALVRSYLRMLLVEVCDGAVVLEKAPFIGWLREGVLIARRPAAILKDRSCGESSSCYLTVPDVLGLNSSWQWYERGVQVPGLSYRLHPWHGVYFPTRCEHVALFSDWIRGRGGRIEADGIGVKGQGLEARFRSEPASPASDHRSLTLASHSVCPSSRQHLEVADIGTGCGVLSFILLEAIPKAKVWATDCNENALRSVEEDARRLGVNERIHLVKADVLRAINPDTPFGVCPPSSLDLIVCNPPWLPGSSRSVLEGATHYGTTFFETLFAQAHAHLREDGQLVLLFSNFAELAGLTKAHPIREELERQNRFVLVEERTAPVAKPRTKVSDWLLRLRQRERVELWVLQRMRT